MGEFQLYKKNKKWFFGFCYATDGFIQNETLIEKNIDAIFVNCF